MGHDRDRTGMTGTGRSMTGTGRSMTGTGQSMTGTGQGHAILHPEANKYSLY